MTEVSIRYFNLLSSNAVLRSTLGDLCKQCVYQSGNPQTCSGFEKRRPEAVFRANDLYTANMLPNGLPCEDMITDVKETTTELQKTEYEEWWYSKNRS